MDVFMAQFDKNHDGVVTFIEYMDGICGPKWKANHCGNFIVSAFGSDETLPATLGEEKG